MANMSDNRFGCGIPLANCKETVSIETGRILDSCRDRDCYENVRVFLTDIGYDIIDHTGNVRTKEAKIAWTYINIDPVPFNRGFYSLTIRFYIKLTFEACVCPGRSQEFEGVAVVEKKVILYGGESNVSVFRSTACDNFCSAPEPCCGTKNVPEAVVEVVDPIILSTKIVEKHECNSCCNCCCCCDDIPEKIVTGFEGCIGNGDHTERQLLVTIGIFSIVRIVRPAQYLISATEYAVPDKECVTADEDNPCKIFNNMAFPVCEFNPPDLSHTNAAIAKEKHCGCQ